MISDDINITLEKLYEIESSPSFALGSNPDIDYLLRNSIDELSTYYPSGHLSDEAARFMVYGYDRIDHSFIIHYEKQNDIECLHGAILEIGKLINERLSNGGRDWYVSGFVSKSELRRRIDQSTQSQFGGQIYSYRRNKAENAPAFLKRVYADELATGTLTLSDLRKRDKSLWSGLRNWANAGNHDLDAIIPRGENKGGRPPSTPNLDPSTLNPDDPRDALALQTLARRAAARESARRRREKNKPRPV